MSPLLYAVIVWFAGIALGEASAGDRDLVYIDCLDSCVEKLCKLRYIRGPSEVEPAEWQLAQQRHLQQRLQQHLQVHYQPRSRVGPPPATRAASDHREKGGEGRAAADTRKEDTASMAVAAAARLEPGYVHGEDHRHSGEGRGGAGEVDNCSLAAAGDGGCDNEGVERYIFSRPWYLWMMGWDCVSECKYNCMTMHVETRISAGQRLQQYYGKWPFRRVWGIQELFASLFSVGNGVPHLYHLLFSRGRYNPPGNYMCFWLTLYPWVGINTWIWSSVFHARDLKWSEAADYFCALLNIFFVVWVAIVRTAGPPRQRRQPRTRRLVRWIGVLLFVYYVLHISFMWFVKFDYGYNMKVALVAGLVHTALWLRYQYRIRDRSYAKLGAISIILLNAAILLEVGDFPPVAYRLLDAHAIWHGVTIPLMFSWYRFVIQDALFEASAGKAI